MKIDALTHRSCLAVVVAASLMLMAGSTRAAETKNRLASNKLAGNRLTSNKLASNRLASNALSSNRLQANLATAEILETEDGRWVYSYIISCALPEGMTMVSAVPGAPDSAPPDTPYTCSNEECVFAGSLGLAEYWLNRRLDPKGQRWITACLLARVNLFEIADAISLRGLAPQLTITPDEAELYTVQEGAFYGNIFTDDEAIDWNACRGEAQASGEFGGLILRDCTEPDPIDPAHTLCGFNYAGDSADYTPAFPSPYACKSFDPEEGTYSECHAGEGDGHWPTLKTYREVITTYVSP